MNLKHYYSESSSSDSELEQFSFSKQQACDFAKGVANDFNAIHDADSSRFCVPGDLLFSVVLSKLGLSQEVTVNFAGMINDDRKLHIAKLDESHAQLQDQDDKCYLKVAHQGQHTFDQALISNLVQEYVRFSGQNFPHILEPLLKQHELMLNLNRPLVIYESMSLHLDSLELENASIEFAGGELVPEGKRYIALLNFKVMGKNGQLGIGQKRMVLGKLLPFEQAVSDELVQKYTNKRDLYLANNA